MKVFLVMGETGEYDDYSSWVACVCGSKRTAEARARKLNEAAGKDGGRNVYRAGSEARKAWFERMIAVGDDAPRLDYTGVFYSLADAPYEVVTRA